MRATARLMVRSGVIAVLGAGLSGAALAQKGGGGPQDGRYSGAEGNWILTLSVQGGRATATVQTRGCIGEIEGAITAGSNGAWALSASENGEFCRVDFTPAGQSSYHMEEGQGCHIWHGAACGFIGQVTRTGQ